MSNRKIRLLPIALVVTVVAIVFSCAASISKAAAEPIVPKVAAAVSAQATPGKLGTGSPADTIATTVKDPGTEDIHVITTTRLDKEDDFEFFRRHLNRVAEFLRLLRKIAGK